MENNLSPDMSESHNVTRETSVSLMDIWLLIRKQRNYINQLMLKLRNWNDLQTLY